MQSHEELIKQQQEEIQRLKKELKEATKPSSLFTTIKKSVKRNVHEFFNREDKLKSLNAEVKELQKQLDEINDEKARQEAILHAMEQPSDSQEDPKPDDSKPDDLPDVDYGLPQTPEEAIKRFFGPCDITTVLKSMKRKPETEAPPKQEDVQDPVKSGEAEESEEADSNAGKPQEPEAPEVPKTPETPETPDTPETPEIPDTPEIPETPEIQDMPIPTTGADNIVAELMGMPLSMSNSDMFGGSMEPDDSALMTEQPSEKEVETPPVQDIKAQPETPVPSEKINSEKPKDPSTQNVEGRKKKKPNKNKSGQKPFVPEKNQDGHDSISAQKEQIEQKNRSKQSKQTSSVQGGQADLPKQKKQFQEPDRKDFKKDGNRKRSEVEHSGQPSKQMSASTAGVTDNGNRKRSEVEQTKRAAQMESSKQLSSPHADAVDSGNRKRSETEQVKKTDQAKHSPAPQTGAADKKEAEATAAPKDKPKPLPTQEKPDAATVTSPQNNVCVPADKIERKTDTNITKESFDRKVPGEKNKANKADVSMERQKKKNQGRPYSSEDATSQKVTSQKDSEKAKVIPDMSETPVDNSYVPEMDQTPEEYLGYADGSFIALVPMTLLPMTENVFDDYLVDV